MTDEGEWANVEQEAIDRFPDVHDCDGVRDAAFRYADTVKPANTFQGSDFLFSDIMSAFRAGYAFAKSPISSEEPE